MINGNYQEVFFSIRLEIATREKYTIIGHEKEEKNTVKRPSRIGL
jgi:hypothetical protein